MELKSDIKELLSGFEKRMKFINIVRCLTDYPYTEKIRSIFPNRTHLDNIIIMVLLYIKEHTLADEKNCNMESVENFINDIIMIFPNCENIDCNYLARYIIVDVLQNGGAIAEYLTYDSIKNDFTMMPIRLLNEEKGNYTLSDDAFDFLFRSKEIESELDYSVTRFRLQEYMKRDNYNEALGQSKELVSRLRNMKSNMDDFLSRCRENLSRIPIDEYEKIQIKYRALLNEEQNELLEIEKNAENREKKLLIIDEEENSSSYNTKAKKALHEIIKNINTTITEQRAVINKRDNLSKEYGELIENGYSILSYERMKFERDIMLPLKKMENIDDFVQFLFFPLTKPTIEKHFSIENFYAIADSIADEEKEEGVDLEIDENQVEDTVQSRNNRFINVCNSFFKFTQNKTHFTISQYIDSLSISQIIEFSNENVLTNVILDMYKLQEIDIEKWKKEKEIIIKPTGEFELSYCLSVAPENILDMKKVIFNKSDKIYHFEISRTTQDSDNSNNIIEITNFEIEVER